MGRKNRRNRIGATTHDSARRTGAPTQNGEGVEVAEESRDETISLNEEVFHLLSTSNEVLRSTNDALQRELTKVVDAQWWLPKVAFGVGTAIFGILFAKNLWDGQEAISSLKMELGEAINKRERLEESWKTLTTNYDDLNSRFDLSKTEFLALQEKTVAVDKAAHRIFSLVSLGQSHLHQRQDPARALHYAELAKDELTSANALADKDDNIKQLVNQLASIVWVLRAEAAWQRNDDIDMRTVSESADQLLSLGCVEPNSCESNEGRFYRGIVDLWSGADPGDSIGEDVRRKRLERCVNEFRHENSIGGNAAVASLYLGATHFELGEYTKCVTEMETFLGRHPRSKSERERLSSRTRAELAIAEAWQRQAKFLQGDMLALEGDFSCSIDIGAIGPGEGRLFEKLLSNSIRRREERTESLSKDEFIKERVGNTFGLFAAKVIAALRRSAGIGNCGALTKPESGCGGTNGCAGGTTDGWRELRESIPQVVFNEFKLKPLTCIHPELSSDRSLGIVENDRLLMERVVIDQIPYTYSETIGNATVQKEGVSEVAKFQIVSFAKDSTKIPEGRYVDVKRFRSLSKEPLLDMDSKEPEPVKKSE